MKQPAKRALMWGIVVVITISSAAYQRSTGPTKPERFIIQTGDETYRFSLKRSHNISRDFHITLPEAPEGLEGEIFYRRFPANEEWTRKDLSRISGKLSAELPLQPPAGKIEYFLELNYNGSPVNLPKDEPVILRFRGNVPALFMIPHILFMFIAMLFSNMTGIMVLFRDPGYRIYMKLTFWSLLIGGLILGPVIQKYAFGDFWTGWPFGQDMTDNKTLVAFLFWALALYTNRKQEKPRPLFALAASAILLLIYFIPHSMMGSELDYSTGEVVTGSVTIFYFSKKILTHAAH